MRALIAFLLVFVVGLALGWGAARLAHPGRTQARQPDAVPAAPAPIVSEATFAPQPVSRAPATATPLAERWNEASLDLPEPPRGTETLEGQVLDEDQRPLPDVLIRAEIVPESENPQRVGLTAPEPKSLEARLQEAVAEHHRTLAQDQEAVTGPDGTFALTHLLDQSYRLKAYRAGYQVTQQKGNRAVSPGDTVQFIAHRLVEVPIRVEYTSGQAPTEAFIVATRKTGSWNRAARQPWSNTQSSLWYRPGTYEMKATTAKNQQHRNPTKPSDVGETSDFQLVTIPSDAPPPQLRFVLEATSGIEGRVLFPEGEETTTCRIYALALQRGETPTAATLKEKGKSVTARTPSLQYLFRNLSPGTYGVAAARGYSSSPSTPQLVEVTEGMTSLDLTLDALDPNECIVARVLSGEGDPVAGATFMLTGSGNAAFFGHGNLHSTMQSPGVYWLIPGGKTRDEWQTESLPLRVHHAEHGSKSIELQQGQASFTVQFEPAARVKVTVSGFADCTYKDQLSVRIQQDEFADPYGWFGGGGSKLNQQGQQILGPVQPGSCKINLFGRPQGAGRWGSIPLDTVELMLQAGQTPVTLSIPALYTVAVHLGEVTSETSLTLSLIGGNTGSLKLSELQSERVEFEMLRAGEYRLTRHEEDRSEQMTIQVPGASELQFTPQAINALEVTLDDERHELAQAGLRTGDHIVSINGQALENSKQIDGLILMAAAKPELTITVQRNQETFEVTLASRLLQKDELGREGTLQKIAR